MMTVKARGLKACGLTVLLSMYSVEQASGAEYSMDLDSPATTGREKTFNVVLRGTSDAKPALGLIGFSAMINYDPQVLSLDALSFTDTDFEESDFALVTDDGVGTIVVAVIRDRDGEPPPAVPIVLAAVDLSLAQMTFRSRSCIGSTILSFGGGNDDNLLVDELLLGHYVDTDLELNGATVNVEATGFIRGNADGDQLDIGDVFASIDMADGLFVIKHLFMGGDAPPCLDAADANDDGRLNLLDPIWIFQLLLGNEIVGLALPKPFSTLGEDPTDDPLDCLVPPLSTLCESP